MDPVKELIKEHEEIERELLELEEISKTKIVNYPNLIHVLNKVFRMWDEHERKEDRIFPLLEKKGFKIPVERILFDHGELKKHLDVIKKAISKGNEFEVKKSLDSDGRNIIERLRRHKDFEDELLYTLPENLTIE